MDSLPDASTTISARLARFIAGLRYDDLPDDVKAIVLVVLRDTLSVGLAGSQTEELHSIRAAIRDAAEDGGSSVLWGTKEVAALPLAALANGAAVHVREMDDFRGCSHSGSVIVPAAVGVATRVGASGAELLAAIVIGYDVARRVMEGGGGYLGLKERGWHPTSTCGVFGAAAAAGRLLGLSLQQLQWALGYAGTNAAGTWAFIRDGAMSKRLHPGFAAQAGVVAAYLARHNVTGPTHIFESDWGGFFPTYGGDGADPEKTLVDLGTDFRIRMVGFKPYAACRGNHSSIDCILELRREHQISPDNVSRIVVRGSRIHEKQLAKQDVQTMLDAQFSLPYSISVALATGGAMLDQYSPTAIQRPEIRAIARRVDVVADPRVANGEQPFVEVHCVDGRILTKRILVARGDRVNPLTEDELRTKFRITAGQVLSDERVSKLEQTIAAVPRMRNTRELAAALVP